MSKSIRDSNIISVTEAADILGCTPGRVRQLIDEKRIKAEYFHPRLLAVLKSDVEKYAKTPRKTGRPRKFAKS